MGLEKPPNRIQQALTNEATWNLAALAIMALGGLLLVALLRSDSAETLGVFNQVYAIFIVFSQMGVGGVQFSTLKHISHHSDDMSACWVISLSGLLLVTLIMLPLVVGLWFLAHQFGQILDSEAVTIGMRLSLPGLLFLGFTRFFST